MPLPYYGLWAPTQVLAVLSQRRAA